MEEIVMLNEKELKRAEIFALIDRGVLSQVEAANQLELSNRQVGRLYKEYKTDGIKALASKKRSKEGNHKLDELLVAQVEERIRARYPDFRPTLAHEKLKEEDGFSISLSSVRKIMIEKEIYKPKRSKKKRIHPRRERRPRFGELIQIDGSPHDWFEGRAPKCCLIVFVDDATSALLGLRFAEAESTAAYFQTVQEYLLEYGRPEAFYSDKHGIFRVNHGSQIETGLTQFGRAMKDLEIRTISAHSPEAKGRVERANGTLQDRLVKELRLRDISSIDDANSFLSEFRKDYNRRFAVAPTNPIDAHRALDRGYDLELILSIQETRQVSKTLSFQYENTHYQILEEGQMAHNLIKKKVLVAKSLKGSIRVLYRDRELTFTASELVRNRPKSLDSKELNSEFEKWLNKKEQYCPPKDHPLRCWKL